MSDGKRLAEAQVEAIRARAEAAPDWHVSEAPWVDLTEAWDVGDAACEDNILSSHLREEDAVFIANAKPDILALLADRAALVAEVERLAGLVDAATRFRFLDGTLLMRMSNGKWEVAYEPPSGVVRFVAEFPTLDAALATYRKSKEP